jgi:energy-converting hydrogenase Eha subunit F
MRICILVLAAVFSLLTSCVAMAAPHALYTTTTGNIQFVVDENPPAPLHMSLISDGILTNASSLLSIPGTIKDEYEFPYNFTYLNMPQGIWSTGNTVVAGTPVDALYLEYSYHPLGLLGPIIYYRGEIVVVPEPAALMLAIAGIASFVLASRGIKSEASASRSFGRRRY